MQPEKLYVVDEPLDDRCRELLDLVIESCELQYGAITLEMEGLESANYSSCSASSLISQRELLRATAIQGDTVYLVEDANLDHRFLADSPLLWGKVRFYAGAPISLSGVLIGALSVFAPEPRTLSFRQQRILERAAKQISALLELRLLNHQLQRSAQELNAQQQMFDTVFNSLPVECCLKNEEGKLLIYNHKFAERFKITRDEWIGRTSYDLWPREIAEQIALDEREARRTKAPVSRYLTIPEGDGNTHWRSTRATCIDNRGCELLLCVGVNVTDEINRKLELEKTKASLEASKSQLQNLLKLDYLTGLSNRRAFEALCLSGLFALKASGKRFSVISVEVGALTLLNRRCGSQAVDEMLRQVAQAMRGELKGSETIARIAGGSFRIYVPELDRTEAEIVAEKLASRIEKIRWTGGIICPATDVAVFDDRHMHAGDLFSAPTKISRRRKTPTKIDREPAYV